jgi:hypothetical protein
MRSITVILIASGLVCSAGCERKDAGERAGQKSGPVAGTEILVRTHFLGTESLATNTNGTRLRELWNLPNSRRLVEQTLNKLAHSPRTLYSEAVAPAQDERGAALLRPLLDDLLRHESFLQVRGPADKRAEWTLLAHLPADRLKGWQAGLAELMQLWKLGAPVTNTVEGFPAWEVRRPAGPALVRWVEAGQWLAIGIGPEGLPALGEAARRIHAGGRPISSSSNSWLEAELDLPQLADALGLAPAIPLPHANWTVTGAGENLRWTGRMIFPAPVTGQLTPWQVPTNFINDPLISFTAARAVGPWLEKCAALQKLGLTPAPNEFFLWAQGHNPIDQFVPFQSFAAFPLKDAAAKLEAATGSAQALVGADSKTPGRGQISWQTNEHELAWKGLLFITPFLRTAEYRQGTWVLGGLFPPSPVANPPPAELLSQLNGQPKLVYYDWEITEARLFQWRVMAQLFASLANKPQFTTNTAGLPWLMAIAPRLGNTVTEITADSPAEWSLVRKSHLGLTGVELVALTRWLESTNFPKLSFSLPPDQPPAAPPKSSPAIRGPTPATLKPGGK